MAAPEAPSSDYLDIDEAAAYIGQSVRWMRNQVARRTLTYYKPGGLLRFHIADLDAFMLSVKVPAEDTPPVMGRPPKHSRAA